MPDLPQREILWNVPDAVMGAVYVLSALAALWVAGWFVWRARGWGRGCPNGDSARPWPAALRRLAGYLLTHRTLARDRYAGLMHALVFWGFVILLIATTLVGIQHHGKIVFLTGTTYLVFSLVSDLGGVAFCVGVGMALWRRRSPAAHGRLLRQRSTVAMLWLLLLVAASGFLVEGLRIARDFPSFERWSAVGWLTAQALALAGCDGEAAQRLHRAAWIAHAALVVGLFVIVPVTLLRHIFLAAYSVARSTGRPGVLRAPIAPITGRVDLDDFRRLDLIEADACLTCGLCAEACPALAAGKPLNPRSVVLGLRGYLDRPDVPLTEHVPDDALWSCTACHACDAACPAGIQVLDKIVTLRRGRVAEAAVPDPAAESLESAAQKYNPFGRANSARLEWASGLRVPVAGPDEPVELLYWVGCAGAFDPAGREVARAMVRILERLGTNYRVLGCRERCTGDPARRLGEEGLWRELAQQNQRTIADHRVRSIVTHCPHCFNTLQNEYPAIGPMPPVLHHTQWLRDRLAARELRLAPAAAERIVLHDPCYLARANQEIEAPRAVLDAAFSSRAEIEPHGRQVFCCGGGGGRMWLEVRGRTRVENIRAAQAEAAAPQTVATACPFCRVMLEAGRTSLAAGQGNWRVRDVAELVAEQMME